MLSHGDECGRTQKGNNNAYCQDNELSWIHWDWDIHAQQLLEFTSQLIHFRRKHPIFRRPKFFQGRKIRGSEVKDIMWFNPGGIEMSDEEWTTGFVRTLGMLLSGNTIDVQDEYGELIRDDTFLLLCNAFHEAVNFVLPGEAQIRWELILDTQDESGFLKTPVGSAAGDAFELAGRSLYLFRQIPQAPDLQPQDKWLDLNKIAQIEITSEDSAHPIEDALVPGTEFGWKAAQSGDQMLRIRFYEPQSLKHIRLVFNENNYERTHEFLLCWSVNGIDFHDILRQQYHLSPPMTEVEEFDVDLEGVKTLELKITPDISGGAAIASLGCFTMR